MWALVTCFDSRTIGGFLESGILATCFLFIYRQGCQSVKPNKTAKVNPKVVDVMSGEREHFLKAQQKLLDRYGVEVESKFVDIPSIRGRAQVLITGKGPALVIINGIGTPAAMWAPLMAKINGYRLFAVDLPGYGLTDTTPGFTDNLRSSAVTFLEEACLALSLEQPVFLANSMGSLWTSWLALDHPERVAALVHIGCPAVVLDTSAPLQMRLLSVKLLGRLLTRLQPPSTKQVEQLSKMVNQYPMVPELVELLVATERLPGFRRMFLSTLNTLLRLGGNRDEMRLTKSQLAGIEQPTLLLWGNNDPFGSTDVAEQVQKALPDARLHIVDGGHAPWLNNTDKIGRIMETFLGELG